MKWFGKSWGAPACKFEEHAETPVGKECHGCSAPIGFGDRGLILADDATVMHLACFIAAIHPCSGCHRCKPEKHPLN